MFNTNSVVAQVWAKMGRNDDDKTIDDVPDLHNLRTIVSEILEGGE